MQGQRTARVRSVVFFFLCVRVRKGEEVRKKKTVISSRTSEMKEEQRRGGGGVDLKCLSVSGGGVMIWRRASDPLQLSLAAWFCLEV